MTSVRTFSRLGLAVALGLTAGCNEGPAPREPVSSSFRPEVDGFSFANFRAAEYGAAFDVDDFIAMVGKGPRVCLDETAAECELTEEAAQFADKVNTLRADGHCEGMVVLASVRFDLKAARKTSEVPAEPEVIDAIIRGFATMFLPEVQAEARDWMSASLTDLVEVLAGTLAEDRIAYGLGIYTPEGGHEVLPYAIEYPRRDLARVLVYDPNWPLQTRYVELDLARDTWRFSFAGDDQSVDPAPWVGGRGDIDLNSIAARVKGLSALRDEPLDPIGTIWE